MKKGTRALVVRCGKVVAVGLFVVAVVVAGLSVVVDRDLVGWLSCGAWTVVLCRRPSSDGSVIKGRGYMYVY